MRHAQSISRTTALACGLTSRGREMADAKLGHDPDHERVEPGGIGIGQLRGVTGVRHWAQTLTQR